MKRSALILIIITSLLSGCVAAVLAGAAASVIVYDRRSLTMLESDLRIFHRIHTKIITNQRLRAAHIEVISFNRIVLLVGEAPSDSARILAERIAHEIPNVRRVYNEITIGQPLSLTKHSKDSLLTGQIRSQMLAQKGLESGSIKIVTENGVVYLMGILTVEEANMAVDIVRQMQGVVKVVKVFQYIT